MRHIYSPEKLQRTQTSWLGICMHDAHCSLLSKKKRSWNKQREELWRHSQEKHFYKKTLMWFLGSLINAAVERRQKGFLMRATTAPALQFQHWFVLIRSTSAGVPCSHFKIYHIRKHKLALDLNFRFFSQNVFKPILTLLCFMSSDIDECAEGLIECHNHSRCVNLPGWYHCECRSGFHDNGSYQLDGSSCIGEHTELKSSLSVLQKSKVHL